MKQYYKQLYVNKFDNLDEIDKLLERHKLSWGNRSSEGPYI